MDTVNQLLALALRLRKANYADQAGIVVAHALELTNIRDVRLITPDHPIYNTLMRVLRPQQLVDDKIQHLNDRLTLES